MASTACNMSQEDSWREDGGADARRLRIMHALPHLSSGGAERQMSYLAPELAQMGHEVHVAYLTERPGYLTERPGEDKPHLPGVHLHRLRASNNYDPRILWQLIRLMRRLRPDILHTWILQMDILGGIAARMMKIPWILGEQSSEMAYPPHWKHHLRVWVGSRAATIVSNSAGGDAYWGARCPDIRRRVIPNGLPLDELAKEEGDSSSNLGIGADEKLVLYVGRLASDATAEKNLRSLLAGFAEAMRTIPMVGLLCGEGPQRRELEEQARKLGIADRIRFAGQKRPAEVWKLLKRADLFVSLSAFEGSPNTVIEAMACGCPLLLSDIPAHRELVDEQSAFFVDPRDAKEVGGAILSVLSDPAPARRRAAAAKTRSARWSIPEMARQYEEVYFAVTGRRPAMAMAPPHIGVARAQGTRTRRSRAETTRIQRETK